jgi:Ca2+-transporting ATPase
MITFGMFCGPMILGFGLVKARTIAFTSLILSQLVNVYKCRGNKGQRPTMYMNAVALTSSALLLGIVYLPPLQTFFSTVPLNLIDTAAVCASTGISSVLLHRGYCK